ncbi:hypothetical protein BDR03DRAFT_969189 [Suillus americanus]|nr:hypothetical protein BDR03DRAFT_969189 [Suillus americanus]
MINHGTVRGACTFICFAVIFISPRRAMYLVFRSDFEDRISCTYFLLPRTWSPL